MLSIQEFTLTGASHWHQGFSQLVKLKVSCSQRHVGTATMVTMLIKSHDGTTVDMITTNRITYCVYESVIYSSYMADGKVQLPKHFLGVGNKFL